MPVVEALRSAPLRKQILISALALGLIMAMALATEPVLATAHFVMEGLINVSLLVIPGALLAAGIAASGAGEHIARIFSGHLVVTILSAALAGALIPVCGITVLPLMAGLLAARVPLAPVMAFWLSSPVTGPPMFAATAATLGWEFAVAKMIAAIGLGVFGGLVTGMLQGAAWADRPLRQNGVVGGLGAPCGQGGQGDQCGPGGDGFRLDFWNEASRRTRFTREALSITRLILIVLTPAFAAEYWLNALLAPDALTPFVGSDNAFAVPLAVLVGAPAYLDGYVALPLTRALMEAGMAPGAAMAFLVAGGVVSIWGALAIAPVLKLRPFLLYLALAVSGSMLAGWLFQAWTSLS